MPGSWYHDYTPNRIYREDELNGYQESEYRWWQV